jgi:hypothetical protein
MSAEARAGRVAGPGNGGAPLRGGPLNGGRGSWPSYGGGGRTDHGITRRNRTTTGVHQLIESWLTLVLTETESNATQRCLAANDVELTVIYALMSTLWTAAPQ